MLLKALIVISLISINVYAERISHNGYVYETVKSRITGNIWLDRSIGVSKRFCRDLSGDERDLCRKKMWSAGDYFQFGRDADGHEKKSSYITSRKSKSIKNAGIKFIKSKKEDNYDWANKIDPTGEKRKANWNKTDGSSICPKGFRVPSIEELKDEIKENVLVMWKTRTSARSWEDGSISWSKKHQGANWFYIWSSSTNGHFSHFVVSTPDMAIAVDKGKRGSGFQVRCIKD
jgi:hypothetical protein